MKWGRPVCISDYGFFFCRIIIFFIHLYIIENVESQIACIENELEQLAFIYLSNSLLLGITTLESFKMKKKMLWCKVMLQSMMMVLGSISVYCSAEFFGALARNLPIIWSFIIMIKQKWYYSGHLSLLNSFNF